MPEPDDMTLDEQGALAGATPGDDELSRPVDAVPVGIDDSDDTPDSAEDRPPD